MSALTGTALTNVGPKPANMTLHPSFLTAPLAVFHKPGALSFHFMLGTTSPTLPVIDPLARSRSPSHVVACIRVLKTSSGNVAIHATTPASPPAVMSSHARSWLSSLSASSMRDSWCRCRLCWSWVSRRTSGLGGGGRRERK